MKIEKSLTKLSKELTNLIDSNKTISRPANVVKELIENSLDAEANTISIFIKNGGLSLIQITDDGKGIEKHNFKQLCSRFNSSKLSEYNQINDINTYGFRGEALSIISYISTVTITSRTKDYKQAFQATYQNGGFSSKQTENADDWERHLHIVNGEVGTTIKIENLFYNNLIRKNTYDPAIEKLAILEMMQFFSVHYSEKNFNLKDANCSSNYLLNTYQISSNNFRTYSQNNLSEPIEIIKRKLLISTIYSKEIVNNLAIFSNEIGFLKINYNCYCSKPSTNLSKSLLIVFINNRLVHNDKIKKLLDYIYSKFLIKHGYYFVYLSITIKSNELDVNVKGNKQEVYFLNEDSFLEDLKLKLEENLAQEIKSKNYYVGDYNTSKLVSEDDELYDRNKENEKLCAKEVVRVDTKVVSIENFLKNPKYVSNNIEHSISKSNEQVLDHLLSEIYFNIPNENKTKILKESYYIGYEKDNKIVFFQNQTSLYILNVSFLLQEIIIFKLLRKNTKIVLIDTGNDVKLEDLLGYVFSTTEMHENKKLGINNDETKEYCQLINENKELFDVIDIEFDNNLIIKALPFPFTEVLSEEIISNFDNYLPLLSYSIIYHLKYYSKEMKKIENLFEIIKILAYYHKMFILNDELIEKEHFIKNIIFDEIKNSKFVLRSNIKIDKLMEKLVDTESLYSVFERC